MFFKSPKKLQRMLSTTLIVFIIFLAGCLSACTLTIRVPAPPPSVEEIMATAVEQTIQADPGARPQEEIATSVAATMQSQPGGAPPGIQIDDRTATPPSAPGSEPDSAQPTPAANPQPDSTNPTQPQQQGSAAPTSTSHMQSLITDTPGLPSFVTDTPGLPFFITDTPGMQFLVTDTPSMQFLSTNTPGFFVLPGETPQSLPQKTAPKAPTDFKFTEWVGEPGSPAPWFQWQSNSDNATGYNIYYVEGNTKYTLNYPDAATGGYYNDLGDICNKNLTFYVTAFNEIGQSDPSNSVVVPGLCIPGAPGSITLEKVIDELSDVYVVKGHRYTLSFHGPSRGWAQTFRVYDYNNIAGGYLTWIDGATGGSKYTVTIFWNCGSPGTQIFIVAANPAGEGPASEFFEIPGMSCEPMKPSGSGWSP